MQIGAGETAIDRCPKCRVSFSEMAPIVEGLTPGDKVAHFELIELVGEGSYGDVWKALDTNLNRLVALKLPRPELVDQDRLLKEARAAAHIQHPAIVEVYEVSIQGNRPYIATELIVGRTLEAVLENDELSLEEAARICQQIAEGIHCAHEAGVIHRDLKPGNIMIDADGGVHITDFGVARRDDGQATMTTDGQIIGTPSYMSPEQARGDGNKADRLTDVYSLGAILYRVLAGNPPFEGSFLTVIPQVLSQEPKTLDRALPAALRAICSTAMAKNPGSRYKTAAELAEDLNRFIKGNKVVAREPLLARANGFVQDRPIVSLILTLIPVLAALYFVFSPNSGQAGTSDPVPGERAVLKTNPPATRLLCIPVVDGTCFRDILRKSVEKTNVTSDSVVVNLQPGAYLIVAEAGDHFHEVIRTMPDARAKKGQFNHNSWTVGSDGTVRLPEINLFSTEDVSDAEDLLPVAGGDGDFGVERTEARLSQARTAEPYSSWVNPYHLGRLEVRSTRFGNGMAALGLPGLTWPNMKVPGAAAVGMTVDQAIAYLELRGCRLPTEQEYEFALSGGTRALAQDWLLPLEVRFRQPLLVSNPAPQEAGPFGHFWLFADAAELTWSHGAGIYVQRMNPRKVCLDGLLWCIRGAHEDFHEINGERPVNDPRERLGIWTPDVACPSIGIRAARSDKPRWNWDTIDVPPDARWRVDGTVEEND